jgi:hypothetical protein
MKNSDLFIIEIGFRVFTIESDENEWLAEI